MIIIESNTIRNVIIPGLFVVIKELKNNTVKPTCAEVIEYADKLVEFSDMDWDFDPNNIIVQNQSWVIEE